MGLSDTVCVFLSVGVKKSVRVRLAEAPVSLWAGCALLAVQKAASAPVHLPLIHCNPALLPHHARDPTGKKRMMGSF